MKKLRMYRGGALPLEYYFKRFKGGSAPKLPPEPPPPPPPSSPIKENNRDVAQARDDERLAEKRKRGRAASILHGGQGLGDNAQNAQVKTLLGGGQ